jgi:hypothetical protein
MSKQVWEIISPIVKGFIEKTADYGIKDELAVKTTQGVFSKYITSPDLVDAINEQSGAIVSVWQNLLKDAKTDEEKKFFSSMFKNNKELAIKEFEDKYRKKSLNANQYSVMSKLAQCFALYYIANVYSKDAKVVEGFKLTSDMYFTALYLLELQDNPLYKLTDNLVKIFFSEENSDKWENEAYKMFKKLSGDKGSHLWFPFYIPLFVSHKVFLESYRKTLDKISSMAGKQQIYSKICLLPASLMELFDKTNQSVLFDYVNVSGYINDINASTKAMLTIVKDKMNELTKSTLEIQRSERKKESVFNVELNKVITNYDNRIATTFLSESVASTNTIAKKSITNPVNVASGKILTSVSTSETSGLLDVFQIKVPSYTKMAYRQVENLRYSTMPNKEKSSSHITAMLSSSSNICSLINNKAKSVGLRDEVFDLIDGTSIDGIDQKETKKSKHLKYMKTGARSELRNIYEYINGDKQAFDDKPIKLTKNWIPPKDIENQGAIVDLDKDIEYVDTIINFGKGKYNQLGFYMCYMGFNSIISGMFVEYGNVIASMIGKSLEYNTEWALAKLEHSQYIKRNPDTTSSSYQDALVIYEQNIDESVSKLIEHSKTKTLPSLIKLTNDYLSTLADEKNYKLFEKDPLLFSDIKEKIRYISMDDIFAYSFLEMMMVSQRSFPKELTSMIAYYIIYLVSSVISESHRETSGGGHDFLML